MTDFRARLSQSANDSIEIHCVSGENLNGNNSYHFVALPKSRVRDFMLALKTRTVPLENYGVVLRSGTGEPDKETLLYIESLLKDG